MNFKLIFDIAMGVYLGNLIYDFVEVSGAHITKKYFKNKK